MCGCHWFVTSRHQQSQPLGIIAARLYLYGAAFHGADLCAFGAAAYRIVKIGQAEITLVIWARKPFRRYAANTLAARHVHAKAARNRPLVLGQGHHGHGSFSLCSWVKAQAALQPCPSARPGVQGARAAGTEGDHPACTSPGRGSGVRKVGETVPDERQRSLAPRGGQRPKQASSGKSASGGRAKDLIRMCKPKNLTSDHPDRRIPDRRRSHEHDEAPLASGAPCVVWPQSPLRRDQMRLWLSPSSASTRLA